MSANSPCAEGYELLVTPPTDTRPHGIFATRAPRRPNPLGLTVVELLGRASPQCARGWLAKAEERR